ncbi:MAG: Mg2+/Co2+ transporter CorB, partial [Porticoccaceae bacterium]
MISGFFSGSETALMSLNRYRLRHKANNGDKAALRTARLLENPDRLISLILLGNNFVNILASAIATVIALRLMGEAGIAVATGLLTLVILVFAEVTPKTFATRRSEQFASIASAVYQP